MALLQDLFNAYAQAFVNAQVAVIASNQAASSASLAASNATAALLTCSRAKAAILANIADPLTNAAIASVLFDPQDPNAPKVTLP